MATKGPIEIIPVLRPKLPEANRLLPYLKRLDASRIYTNWGPLVREFESRLAKTFGVPEGAVVAAASGTAALTGAILAQSGPACERRPLALVPSFTFVGSATAAEQSGYRVALVDIDPITWRLEPETLQARPSLIDRAGIVIPVAAYGRPVPQASWQTFSERTGVRVVIDGAASYESLIEHADSCLGDIPVAVSFHATKSFATGEGGCVVSRNLDVAARVTAALNFGFKTARATETRNINGKMSEYHAAVGLAELDGWAEKRQQLCDVVREYRHAFAASQIADRLVAFPEIGLSYVLMCCANVGESADVQRSLTNAGVDFRLWYGHGLHAQSYFAGRGEGPLNVTDSLASRVIGLPVAVDLPATAIQRVVDAITIGSRERLRSV